MKERKKERGRVCVREKKYQRNDVETVTDMDSRRDRSQDAHSTARRF